MNFFLVKGGKIETFSRLVMFREVESFINQKIVQSDMVPLKINFGLSSRITGTVNISKYFQSLHKREIKLEGSLLTILYNINLGMNKQHIYMVTYSLAPGNGSK